MSLSCLDGIRVGLVLLLPGTALLGEAGQAATAPTLVPAAAAKVATVSEAVDAAVIDRHLRLGTELLATDLTAALAELREAAKSQRADAMHLLGRTLFYSVGTAEVREEAIRLIVASALQGDAEAQMTLATMHFLGDGVDRDPALAFELQSQAAGSGHPMAHAVLAQSFLQGSRAVPRDYVLAVAHGNVAVALGEAGGHTIRVQAGRELTPAEASEARRLTEEIIAGLKERFPERLAALEYRAGIDHLLPDDVKALQRRAEDGDVEAMMTLANLFTSEMGVPLDHGLAVHWTRRAAERGHVPALIELGTYFLQGIHVPRDPLKAWVYFTAADTLGGDEFTKERVNEARDQLTSHQAATASQQVLQLLKSIHATKP